MSFREQLEAVGDPEQHRVLKALEQDEDDVRPGYWHDLQRWAERARTLADVDDFDDDPSDFL
jgi:hypothetical protein